MATRTWNGGSLTTNNWNDAANWGGTAPVAGDSLIFAGTVRLAPFNDFAANTIFASITFAVGAGNFVLSGAAVNLSGGAAAISCLANAGTMTIGNNLVFATAAPTINTATGGTMTISGTVDNGGLLITTTGGGLMTISGNISGAGGAYINCGLGYLNVFSGASNAFTGAVNIFTGGLRITNSAGLGTGTKTITINNGTLGEDNLRLDGSGGDIVLPSTLSFSTSSAGGTYGCIYNEAGNNIINGTFSLTTGGGGTSFFVNGGTLTVNGVITAASATREVILNGSGNGTLNSKIAATNAPGLRKEGTGAWTVTGANDYTGATAINGGTLYANGRALSISAVTVTSPGILRVAGNAGTGGGRGIMARYYNITPTPSPFTVFNSLSTIVPYFADRAANLTTCDTTMNKTDTGTNFPPPYNSDASNFLGYFTAKLVVPNTGLYTFNTRSDDGSMLYIGSTAVVSNNGSHGLTTVTGTITLTAGVVYDLTIVYYNGTGGYGLNAQISGAGNTTMTDLSGDSTLFYLRSMDLVIGSLAGTGSVVLDSGSLACGDAGNTTVNTTFSGVISTSSSLGIEKTGAGALTLTGTNTYSGPTKISRGTLNLGNGTTDGTILNTLVIFVGNFYSTTTAALVITNIADQTYSAPFVGNGTFTKAGAGTLTKAANNSYTDGLSGAVTISVGSLKAAGCLTSGLVTVTTGAFLKVVGFAGLGSCYTNANSAQASLASKELFYPWMGNQGSRRGNIATSLNMGSGGANFPFPYNYSNWGQVTISTLFAGKLTVAVSGTYTFRLGSDDGSMLWIDGTLVVSNNASQAYTQRTGTIDLTAGTVYDLTIGFNNSGGQYGFTGEISGANNTTYVPIDTANANTTLKPDLFIGSLTGGGEVQLTEGDLWMGDGNSQTFTGTITGGYGILKWGAGNWGFSAALAYTGPTDIILGLLRVTGSLSTGPITVWSGGTLAGSGGVSGAVSALSGGIIAPGEFATPIGILETGPVTLAAGSIYAPDLNGTTPTFDQINVTGAVSIAGNLNIASIAVSTTGKVYTIVNATGTITGEFTGKTNGSTFKVGNRKFLITYNTNTVVLTDQGPGVTSRFLPFFIGK